MKLTKYQKTTIINAIVADLPDFPDDEYCRRFQDALIPFMPGEVQAVARLHPEWLDEYHYNVYPTNGTRWSNSVTLRYRWKSHLDYDDLSPGAKSIIDEIQALVDQRHSFITKVEALVNGSTTRESLLKKMPEFEKYLPAPEYKSPDGLPICANLMAEAIKLGWPKGKEPCAS